MNWIFVCPASILPFPFLNGAHMLLPSLDHFRDMFGHDPSRQIPISRSDGIEDLSVADG
jgi:hypothetical protein